MLKKFLVAIIIIVLILTISVYASTSNTTGSGNISTTSIIASIIGVLMRMGARSDNEIISKLSTIFFWGCLFIIIISILI